jgi:2-polyprenyl-3-methyl-5-hydroxy-6-metoxy-1,4-benzoquinol methylase
MIISHALEHVQETYDFINTLKSIIKKGENTFYSDTAQGLDT